MVTVVALIEWFVKHGCIPALEVIQRNMFSSELWPSGTEQNHTSSLAGLNVLQGLLGPWKRVLDFGSRCLRHFEMSFTGQHLEPGLSKIFPFDSSSWSSRPPWRFFVAKTAPRSLLTSKYSSPTGVFLNASMVFFMVCWFFRPLLPRKRLINNRVVSCNFSRIKRVKLDELSFIVQLFNYLFCQRMLITGCWSYFASFAESFQIIAEGFVGFCKKRVLYNGKLGLFSGGLFRCRSRAARIAGTDYFIVKFSVAPSCRQIKLLQALAKLLWGHLLNR